MSGKKLNEIKPVVAKDKEDLIKIIEDTRLENLMEISVNGMFQVLRI